MSGSLSVWDYTSRHRSKSPSGRHRDRSRSRDVRRSSSKKERSRSRRPSKYYDDDLGDDPRFIDPRRERSKSYSDEDSADDDVYRRLAKTRHPPGHYYLSDEEEFPAYLPTSSSMRRSKSSASRPSKSYAEKLYYESERERDKRYSSRHLRPEPRRSSRSRKYGDPVLDTDEEEDDDRYAYGAEDYYGYPPSSRRHRSRGRVSKGSEKVYYDDEDDFSDASLDYSHRRKASRSRTREEKRRSRLDVEAATLAAAGASSNLDEYEKYLRQLQNLRSDTEKRRRSPSRSRPRSKSVTVPPAPELDDDWAEIPECERPDFVPPQPQADPVPVGVQQAQAPPPQPTTGSRYSFANIPGLGFLKGNAAPDTHPAVPPAQNDPYLSPEYAAASQPTPPPPLPKMPQQPAPPPAPSPSMQYPMIPPSQYMQQQPQQLRPSQDSYVRPLSAHQRAASTGGRRDPQQYASPAQYQYAKVDDFKLTPTPVKPSVQQASPTASPQNVKYATTNPVAHAPDVSQYLEVNSKPGLRRTTTARPHSISFSSHPNTEQLNVPGSFPDPPPPPGIPMVELRHDGHNGGKPGHWPSSFSKYIDDPYLSDHPPASGASIKRSSSKASKAEKANEKIERWVQLNRKTGSLESITSSKPPPEPEVVYDPKHDAKALKSALSGVANTRVDAKPLITLLPYLTSEEMATLRAEYRRIVRVNGKGLNLAKHLLARVPGNFAKACHSTALGHWDSEAYFIKMYQDNPQRRELLIETLVGRTNEEIEKIKACYKANYGDSLDKVMKSELKADKFRMAIMLSLTESRPADDAPQDPKLIHEDVRALRRALIDGSEMDMLYIILMRGNAHLRDVFHVYKDIYKENFAREMIAKSRNVIGEILLHVFNGALNRPKRDANYLHQAIAECEPGRDRAELLISRLVRLHWDPEHLERVKDEYLKTYGKDVEMAIEDEILAPNVVNGHGHTVVPARNTDWVEFCMELVKSSAYHAGADEDDDDGAHGS